MFTKMPFILVTIILATILLDPIIPFVFKQTFYSLSLTIKSIIIFLLPFIIFGLLFKAVVMLSNSTIKIIGLILILICVSNFIATFLSYYMGMLVYNLDLSVITPKESNGLTTLWSINLPQLIANDKAMFSGIIMGIIASKLAPIKSMIIGKKMELYIGKLFAVFTYFIPLFVIGFVMKLQYDDSISILVKNYADVFLLIIFAQFGYIAFVYFALNNFRFKDFLINIKNMLPAAISGFSTMSSAVSMPLTIIGVENNIKDKDIALSVVPATVNVHLIGDCFAIPIFAYTILKSYGMAEPSLLSYLIFACYFVIAKFSVAAVPGGGIIMMLPILEHYLGFNAEMLSLITALYILFDPIITCANVLGNGAFAQMFDRLVGKFNLK
jgi:Na+/H+-dicarboxylate symporter